MYKEYLSASINIDFMEVNTLRRFIAVAILLVMVIGLLAGCGETDQTAIEKTMYDFEKALNAGDVDALDNMAWVRPSSNSWKLLFINPRPIFKFGNFSYTVNGDEANLVLPYTVTINNTADEHLFTMKLRKTESKWQVDLAEFIYDWQFN